jgi:hypothetical protein
MQEEHLEKHEKYEHYGSIAIGWPRKRSKKNIMALEQLDCLATLVREASQLETIALLGSTSKRSITTLIIS